MTPEQPGQLQLVLMLEVTRPARPDEVGVVFMSVEAGTLLPASWGPASDVALPLAAWGAAVSEEDAPLPLDIPVLAVPLWASSG